jgi:hypothetical protein
MAGGFRPNAGRKPVEIDLVELEKLCSLQCTDEEIAYFFGVTPRTIENRRRHRKFDDVMKRGRAKGRISVASQMKLLEAGNSTMGVWLGKQLLGQRDVVTNEITGSGGGPIAIACKPDLSRLTDDELQQLRALTLKTKSCRRD